MTCMSFQRKRERDDWKKIELGFKIFECAKKTNRENLLKTACNVWSSIRIVSMMIWHSFGINNNNPIAGSKVAS